MRAEDKPAVLLHLLRCVVKPQEQTVVFVATKHHAEYLKEVRAKEDACISKRMAYRCENEWRVY